MGANTRGVPQASHARCGPQHRRSLAVDGRVGNARVLRFAGWGSTSLKGPLSQQPRSGVRMRRCNCTSGGFSGPSPAILMDMADPSRAPGGPLGRWDRIPAPKFAPIQIPATGNVLEPAQIRGKPQGSQRRSQRGNSLKTPSKTRTCRNCLRVCASKPRACWCSSDAPYEHQRPSPIAHFGG